MKSATANKTSKSNESGTLLQLLLQNNIQEALQMKTTA